MDNKYHIAIVGDQLQVHMVAAYLAKELNQTDIQLTPIVLANAADPTIKHAFAPFTPILGPLTQTSQSSAIKGFKSLTIKTPHLPQKMPFNFDNYGAPSTAVNFHQALEVSQTFDSSTPDIGSFLSKDKNSFGITYNTNTAKSSFQRRCNLQDIYTICTASLTVKINNEIIHSITTQEGQEIQADLFLDCSNAQVIMRQLQSPVLVDAAHIPAYTTQHTLQNTTQNSPTTSGSAITCSANTLTCELVANEMHAQRSYHFADNEQSEQVFYFAKPWVSNCVSLGNGYCNLPDVLICRDRILESQLLSLVPFLPIRTGFTSAQNHVAMHTHRVLNEAIDSVNLLASAASANLQLTANNLKRSQLFESSGALHQSETAMINSNCWGALMRAVGIAPKATNALAQARSAADISQKVKQLITSA